MIGTKLGPYEIREEIGQGGMAAVYRAYQPTVDRDVAIKVILKGIAGNPGAVQRFQREARLIARLEHPHILPVYDFDGTHEPPYIVMRYLNGGTLRTVIDHGILPLDEVAYLMRQICSALDYAHRQGIVHRDIKPTNILIDREGNAFVSDFGLARLAEQSKETAQLTEAGAIMGTPEYMSPEQASAQDDIDGRTDIYALGVMLFQMLTGSLPFDAPHMISLLLMHLQAPIPSARALRPDLPAEIDPVLQRAMAKQRELRYATGAELGIAITEALGESLSNTSRLQEVALTSILRRIANNKPPTDSKKTSSEQNKMVTALYANATDYAELVEASQSSEAARGALTAFWSACQHIVEQQSGFVASRTDTELLALWGTETARENDTEQAVRSALEMQNVLRQLAGDLLTGDDLLPLNIGVNSGLALLTPNEKTGSVMGSGTTINIANRLMNSASGSILVSHEVFRRTLGLFDMQLGEALKMRGREEKIDTYSVLLAKPRSFRLETPTIEGIQTRQIGRDTELQALQKALISAIEDSETKVVTVIGEAGIGKSRLLYEFDQWVELRPETVRVFRGRATVVISEQPYSLIRSVISARCEIQDNDPPTVVRQKMEVGIAGLMGQTTEAIETAHTIGYLCGFDFNESQYIKGLLDDPSQIVKRARQLFVRLFTTLARQEPVTLALEDIHLADDASLDLLNLVFTTNPNIHLAVIATARPALYEHRPTWGSGQDFHHRLTLSPLDKHDSRDLVREILKKVPDVPKALRDVLVERAEGNPYYLEELVKTLIDQHVILKERDDVWRVEESRLGTLWLPSTLMGLLEARLDTLLYPEKLTLQRAAVIGRVFYNTSLLALDDDDETHVGGLANILEKLISRGFIERRETTAFTGSIEYTFSSGLLRDALLNALLRRQVTSYNRAAADWLSGIAQERVSEYALQIAEHYEKADERERAGEVLLKAGEQAEAVSAYLPAIALLERALLLLPETMQAARQQAALKLGAGYRHTGNYKASFRNADLALTLARQRSDTNGQAEAIVLEAGIWQDEGDLEQSKIRLREAEALAEVASTTRARILYMEAFQAYLSGNYSQLALLAQASLDIARGSGSPLRILNSLDLLGVAALLRGKYNEARQLEEECLTVAQTIGAYNLVAAAHNMLGEIYRAQGDYIAAQSAYQQAWKIDGETGNRRAEVTHLSNLALVALLLRQPIQSRDHALSALRLSRAIGLVPYFSMCIGELAGVQALDGDKQTALHWLGAALNQPTANDEIRRDLETVFVILREMLSEAEIKQGLEEGKSLDFEALVTSLLEGE